MWSNVRSYTGLEFANAEEVQHVGVEPVVAKVEYGQQTDSHHHADRTPGEEEAEHCQQPHEGATDPSGFDQPTAAGGF